MRTAWLVLLVGCELDVVPAKNHAAPTQSSSSPTAGMEIAGVTDPQTFEVTVREHGTEAPIAGAIVELSQFRPCYGDAQVCLPSKRTLKTDSDGIVRITLPPVWGIERISAPGYLTQCPVLNDDEWRHGLVEDSKKEIGAESIFIGHTHYLCHLVPPSALIVRDRAEAIRLARGEPEIARWLRDHRNAKPMDVQLNGLRWVVRFETPKPLTDDFSEARHVVVDGLDRSAHVLAGWD